MSKYNIGKKLKHLRLSRNLSMREVARETGFSAGLISQIENNNISPPIATLSRILKFFDIKIDTFFDEIEEERKYQIVRKRERKKIPMVVSSPGSSHGYSYESLSCRNRNRKMKPRIYTLSGTTSEYAMCSQEGEKFLFILKGTAEIRLDEELVTLQEGDGIYFDSKMKQRFFSRHGREVIILSVEAE